MAQTTLTTSKWKYPKNAYLFMKNTLCGLLNAMFTELYQDTVITFPVTLHASKTIHNIFIAKRGYTVTSIEWVGDVAQAINATVVKAVGTATPAIGTTPMVSSVMSLNTTAHTVLAGTLTSTSADLVLASGNRIAVVLSAALTTGSGVLNIRMTKT